MVGGGRERCRRHGVDRDGLRARAGDPEVVGDRQDHVVLARVDIGVRLGLARSGIDGPAAVAEPPAVVGDRASCPWGRGARVEDERRVRGGEGGRRAKARSGGDIGGNVPLGGARLPCVVGDGQGDGVRAAVGVSVGGGGAVTGRPVAEHPAVFGDCAQHVARVACVEVDREVGVVGGGRERCCWRGVDRDGPGGRVGEAEVVGDGQPDRVDTGTVVAVRGGRAGFGVRDAAAVAEVPLVVGDVACGHCARATRVEGDRRPRSLPNLGSGERRRGCGVDRGRVARRRLLTEAGRERERDGVAAAAGVGVAVGRRGPGVVGCAVAEVPAVIGDRVQRIGRGAAVKRRGRSRSHRLRSRERRSRVVDRDQVAEAVLLLIAVGDDQRDVVRAGRGERMRDGGGGTGVLGRAVAEIPAVVGDRGAGIDRRRGVELRGEFGTAVAGAVKLAVGSVGVLAGVVKL